MELSELTAYAAEKYHIQEQRKWSDFPGFSVLADPESGKWHALLMRQWDEGTGTEIQRCDIKCGRQCLTERPASYLGMPFRMKGKNWVGVAFEERTDPETVFRLFDQAVRAERGRGYTVILEERKQREPDPGEKGGNPAGPVYRDTALPIVRGRLQGVPDSGVSDVPVKIREMKRLYEFGDGSLSEKSRNFYRQGMFMKDYEDDLPWTEVYKRYFPTYHDLNDRQLRGYFTWRTHVRKGVFPWTPSSFAYIYLYELLSGIGVTSPEESLRKMEAFARGFLDKENGDESMRVNLRRWMFEYAVLHGLPVETVRGYADPAVLERDLALSVLKEPQAHTEEEIFSALCTFYGEKLKASPVLAADAARGKHLFAAVWSRLSAQYTEGGKNIFTACFGKGRGYNWNPLANAVHWEESAAEDTEYTLNACRIYRCRGGVWQEEKYEPLYFDKEKLRDIVHETDRYFRRYLKTGHYLRAKQGAEWVLPYLEAVAEEERRAEAEAARPKITINLAGLEKIRQDSLITRDALLVEEIPEDLLIDEEVLNEAPSEEEVSADAAAAEQERIDDAGVTAYNEEIEGLDPLHRQILAALLSGQEGEALIRDNHLMPSIVADTINEALFGEIGDSILECDGDVITVVEDYREDVMDIIGE